MASCPICDRVISERRERVGARCPGCRQPLYEPPGRFSRPLHPDEAACSRHAGQPAVGFCTRCKARVCETCRSLWAGQVVCIGCINRLLSRQQAVILPQSPAIVVMPTRITRQAETAWLALYCGVAIWLLTGLAVWLYVQARQISDRSAVLWSLAAVGLLAVNVLPAGFSLGAAITALRRPGAESRVAFLALGLAGVYLGLGMGLAALALWHD
jgi:hypothetical protein